MLCLVLHEYSVQQQRLKLPVEPLLPHHMSKGPLVKAALKTWKQCLLLSGGFRTIE